MNMKYFQETLKVPRYTKCNILVKINIYTKIIQNIRILVYPITASVATGHICAMQPKNNFTVKFSHSDMNGSYRCVTGQTQQMHVMIISLRWVLN